ncbi:MAG: VOC family protein, partial [Edaphobacter sp.]
ANACRSTVIPAIRYRNALPAIDWLIRAFGFEKQAVYLGPDNKTVMHAQLTFGNGMVMLGSVENGSEHSKLMVQPDEIGLRETQTPCLIVTDADAVYATAKSAGATIVMDIADMPYGGRAFTCRDLEGHLWNIGTYDPWEIAPPQ